MQLRGLNVCAVIVVNDFKRWKTPPYGTPTLATLCLVSNSSRKYVAKAPYTVK